MSSPRLLQACQGAADENDPTPASSRAGGLSKSLAKEATPAQSVPPTKEPTPVQSVPLSRRKAPHHLHFMDLVFKTFPEFIQP